MIVIVIRGIILYALIMASLRLMGKRQLGELQPSELVVTILISNIASLPLENLSAPMLAGVIPVLTLVCLDVFMSGFMLKFHRFRRFVSGNPIILISHGKVNQKQLRSLRYTIDELFEAMRESSIYDLNDVQYAIVENNGKINFYEKQQQGSTDNLNPPEIIIRDGVIDHKGLIECGLNTNWLEKTVKENKLKVNDIFLMTSDEKANYNIIKKDGIP
ncbi:MAG: DUF421 domain-containing protein [Clostridiales bacterium]|nr:DUF421 domain-containing protein [Clostridiales bacterium]